MREKNNSKFSGIFDTVFIMALCFGTLFVTMIFQGGVIVGGDSKILSYIIKWPSFIITIGGLAIYLAALLKESNKELRNMIDFMYNKKQNKANWEG